MSDSKYVKPDFVQNYKKPKNTEIKHINGYWYLYEKINYYDKKSKRSRTKSGAMLGKITPDGFVPKKIRLEKAMEGNDVVEMGITRFFYERTSTMRCRLEKYFPDIWEKIYVTALLRTSQDNRFRRLQVNYEDSVLYYMYPGISFSGSAMTSLLDILGRRREAIRMFMQEDVVDGEAFLLCDGHRLISASRTLENAEIGYDSKQRYKPQVNVLYMFTLGENTGSAAFYKQYVGSTPDTIAFRDIIHDADAYGKDCTVIADKAFSSEGDIQDIEDCGLHYVIPMKRGNRYVKGRIPDIRGFTDAFSFHGRGIQSIRFDENETYSIHLFFDTGLFAQEFSDLTQRTEKRNETAEKRREQEEKRRRNGKGRLSDEELALLEPVNAQELLRESPEMGMITIKTDRKDLNSCQVYSIYKQRQAIEQAFKTNDCTMDQEASYMRNNYSEEAWLFLNHLGLMMSISTLDEIATIGQTKDISYKDLVQTLRKIKINRINGDWFVVPVKESIKKLCSKMGIDIEDLSGLPL